jgi:hypothetical protein
LIIEDPRDLPWNIGIMEYWNDGLRREKKIGQCLSIFLPSTPLFHYSITPCGWPPLLQQISLKNNGILSVLKLGKA